MRMRKKKHSAERIAACAEFLADTSALSGSDPGRFFPQSGKNLLEIGCGKGDFAVGLSAAKPDSNIIAVERVPDVAMFALEKAAATAGERPDNLRFIIGNGEYLNDWFAPHTFDGIYLNFSDPWPRTGEHKRRLTAPAFLRSYSKLLKAGGTLSFKTDNRDLFLWSVDRFRDLGLEIAELTEDLHSSEYAAGNIMTEYERRFVSLGTPINYAKVVFSGEIPPSADERKEKKL